MSTITFYNSTSKYPISNLTYNEINTVKVSSTKKVDNDEVFISDESRKMFLALQEHDFSSPLKFDKQFLDKDYFEQSKLDFAKSISERQDLNPLENEFQILGVKYIFQEGTLEQFLTEKLEGKTKNASLLASEISKNIRGTVYNPNATIEERAINRKTVLKLCEYIAQNYFYNEDEFNEFLAEINKYVENDVMREKGYVVFDNSDIEPFKNYTFPNATNDYINASSYAKKYGYTNFEEILNDHEKLEDFLKVLNKNGETWTKQIVKEFKKNEQLVQSIIDKAVPLQTNEQYVENIIKVFL
ncbi:hypothetical protein GC105_06735 [Alkalibaculum sp. M08DMB]|uniref:Uncharacterized protein n=1 Tax=Alkalibaculum sporogenes TaxID=2655001 RepID=A0A6A7K7T2_9FIRM|nr:hypothetical protein [Alkalibaculum sporogenes]MPW25480.1 hypothetical protein [Alkalibaculum sporogenes]